ncbi:unnamed protein product [Arabidopsis thaliana]|uniref:Uncharacterized protein n=1 Tax=Arabidopsis thaliana TaxID=3702 RepID=Q9LJQ0_ARATH|nr:unnamed protein product [Arabidopsis thaliana]
MLSRCTAPRQKLAAKVHSLTCFLLSLITERRFREIMNVQAKQWHVVKMHSPTTKISSQGTFSHVLLVVTYHRETFQRNYECASEAKEMRKEDITSNVVKIHSPTTQMSSQGTFYHRGRPETIEKVNHKNKNKNQTRDKVMQNKSKLKAEQQKAIFYIRLPITTMFSFIKQEMFGTPTSSRI